MTIKEKDQELQDRIKAVAKRYKHWGLLKIYRKLRKQGETANHKRVRRLYRIAGLTLPRKLKKRLPESVLQPLPKATACNGCWSLDFTSDALTDGRKFRTLNVIDDSNREALGVETVRRRGRLFAACAAGNAATRQLLGTLRKARTIT
ncbi:MAG: transposase [Cytophagaceae bacterium]|nr:MAG: transposase [Cytophagaceae bacterium]